MNTDQDLFKRLLKLYPVKLVKEEFNPDETNQVEIIQEIVNNNSSDIIKKFAVDNHLNTKQHVYFYSLSSSFIRTAFNLNNLDLVLQEELFENSIYYFKFLPKIEYDVVLGSPFEETILNFIQPVTVCVSQKILIIHATIMEKNIDYYFGDRKVYEANKTHGEDQIIQKIIEHFTNFFVVEPLDLNKGIKELWKNDVIDSKYAKWKKSHSTSTEQMDEEFTLKQKYPALYAELVTSPLNRTIFKNITDIDDICSHFTIDPTKGYLTITIYPGSLSQVNNVINKILANN